MNDATILIIDDEPSNIQTIINSLKISNYKYKLLSASNSKLGIEIATTVIPNLILIDWQMPELTGIEVIRKLKKNTKTCDIPIIMITGIRMTSEDLKIALESGAVDFIRKPIDEIELIARINSALTIVKYYTQKIIAENLVRKITEEKALLELTEEKALLELTEEKALLELEAKKRELLSYSTKLHHIVKLYETFAQKLTSDECVNCNLCETATNHTNEMIHYSNQQIWKELEAHLKQVNNNFLNRLSQKFPLLTGNEKKICGYLVLHLSTKDVASITNQTVRSIEIARTRLREKLGLKGSTEDISQFLNNI